MTYFTTSIVFSTRYIEYSSTAQFLFGAGAILGGIYVLRHNAFPRMDVFYSRFSPRGKAILDLITVSLFFAFCGVMLWQGGRIAWDSALLLERSPSQWSPPVYPIKMVIPVAAFLILLQGLARFVRDLITSITGKQVP